MTARARSTNMISGAARRPLEIIALTSLVIALTGCGGGGGGGDSSNDFNPSNPCNVVLTIVTAGLSCALGVITGIVPTDPSSPPTIAPPPTITTPGAFRYQIAHDLEPNDDLATAAVAHFPMRAIPEQRVGFRVDGTINDLTDGVDTFSFSSSEPRTLRVELCVAGSSCDAARLLDVGVAFVEVLDQFGTILWTTEADTTTGNSRNITIDAGVLYYVAVVGENTSGGDTGYLLKVVETSDPADPMTLQTLVPNAPLLSVSGAPSLTVTLDWAPPATNTDGSALLDLSGYTISYADVSGPCCGNYPTTEIDLDTTGLVTYVLDLPGPGDWAISMTARNSMGQESAASNTVTVTVDDPWTIPVPGQVVTYQFTTGPATGSGSPFAQSFSLLVSGAVVSGTFDYDNSAPLPAALTEATWYDGAITGLTGSVNGMSFSDYHGVAFVSDDRYGAPAVHDMLQLIAGGIESMISADSSFVGFEVGGYRLESVRIMWTEGQAGATDFLTSENLPTALPRFEGSLALDFVSITDPTNREYVFFDGVFVTPIG